MSINKLISQLAIIASLESLTRAIDTGIDFKRTEIGKSLPARFKNVEVRTGPKYGRNEVCKCGSGKKNKQCCKIY